MERAAADAYRYPLPSPLRRSLIASGIVFDIREFTLHDGPGLRTTVFLKGCPLRCSWCHNPEGMSMEPQIMRSRAGERVVGKVYTALELATLLNKQAGVLRACEGGVTFSGGEPLMQAQFVSEVIDLLEDLHIVLDTSGYASEGDFRMVAGKSDLVYYDLKLVDRQAHLYYTGVDSAPILSNLRILSSMGLPFVVRVPLIPSVTDTRDNLLVIAETIRGLPGLERVDLLPYNKAAGGKYKGLGMEFQPAFDEGQDVNIDAEPFVRAGITVNVEGVDMAALGSKRASCQ